MKADQAETAVAETATPGADVPARPKWGPRGMAAASIAGRLGFDHVSHAFGGIEAVRDVSLELGEGEVMCLLGPSGCGKTTLLRIAAGLERQLSGRVLLDGREVSGPDAFVPPEKRGIGLMFQDFALFPHLTIMENVTFGLKGRSSADARGEARRALARVGMNEFENAYPHALSGGEQQRVALARAIAPRPAVLLMDEPFSGLDQRLRDSVRDETLAVLKETRASCLLVTHDPEEAMRLADRIALMRDGRLAQLGPPEELYNRPGDIGVARFFCDFNELTGFVDGKHVTTPLGRFKAGGLPDKSLVDVLIRPQGLKPVRGKPVRGKQGIAATVLAVRFLGDASLVTLVADGMEEPVIGRFAGDAPPEKGSDITVAVDEAQVILFGRA